MYGCDKTPTPCRGDDKATLPRDARLPINRCNLPAVILGSLAYQRHPAPLLLDGIAELHPDLFRRLEAASDATRPDVFRDYMTVRFRLEWLEEVGLTRRNRARAKANYIKAIRGWSFDSDSAEGAVLKGWVESRFGLMPRYHREALRDPAGDAYRRYLEQRAQGLYGTNALEAQLDLLYTYCQFELARRHGTSRHVTLYRGVNRLTDHEVLRRAPTASTSCSSTTSTPSPAAASAPASSATTSCRSRCRSPRCSSTAACCRGRSRGRTSSW